MAILRGYRVPDSLILAYPGKYFFLISLLALNLSMNSFIPSILLALDDPILPYPFLKMCLESYIGERWDPDTQPLISPAVASEDILKQFPKTRILVASNDPIRDQSFKFTLKLAYDKAIYLNIL